MLDGVYVKGEDGLPVFVPAPSLTDDDVRAIVETTAKRVVRLCQRRGLFEEGSTDPLWEQEPLLAQISAASVQGMVATGKRAGRKVRRRLTDPEDGARSGALCYASRGFSLHAATRIEATDRRRLERLCRYVIRPPVASGRLRFVDEQTLGVHVEDALGRRYLPAAALPAGIARETGRSRNHRHVSTWCDITVCWDRRARTGPRSCRARVH